MERAARAPSAGNIQPWRVDALAGERLEALKALMRPRMSELPKGEGTEYAIYPARSAAALQRRAASRSAKCSTVDRRPREDKPARYRQYARNFEFFGAPVGLFVSIERAFVVAQWVDLGSYIQNIMLLARDYGLHTCPQEAWASFSRPSPRSSHLPPTHDAVLRHRARPRRRAGRDQFLARAARAIAATSRPFPGLRTNRRIFAVIAR